MGKNLGIGNLVPVHRVSEALLENQDVVASVLEVQLSTVEPLVKRVSCYRELFCDDYPGFSTVTNLDCSAPELIGEDVQASGLGIHSHRSSVQGPHPPVEVEKVLLVLGDLDNSLPASDRDFVDFNSSPPGVVVYRDH